ncbi:MAG: hypothetical protein JW857_05675 [Bacteroidales bacterium]|nr:hypothetical protein [Bacteroidales bacterium]
MNKNQINKSRMYFACDLVLDNHSDLVNALPEFLAAHENLKNKLLLIEQYRQVQEVDSTGLTLNKSKLRVDLSKLILQFNSVLKAYAAINKDEVLKTKASYNASSLTRSSDPILYDIGLLLLNLATPLKLDLERFFLTQESFDSLASILEKFKTAIPEKRIAVGTSKLSTKHIQETFAAIDLLLKEEIDVLIAPFEFMHEDFYNEYKNARIIIDYAGGGKVTSDENN